MVTQGVEPFVEPAPADLVRRVRERWQLPADFVLAVDGGDPRKNLPFLMGVLDELASRSDRTLPLVVVGRSRRVHPSPPSIRSVSTSVVNVGPVTDEELHGLYSGASVFCFPSLAEGFGRPPLEAVACGTATIVADYGPAREVMGKGAEILPLDRALWTSTLDQLLRDADRRLALANRGREVAAAYRWDRTCDQVLEACGGGGEFGDPSVRPMMSNGSSKRVALVHDWLTGMRGGERVLDALLELFPQAEIFTLIHRPGSVSPRIESRTIHTSFVDDLPFARGPYRYFLPLFPRAVESFDLAGFDLVISSSHCVAKGARPPLGVPHVCYCHTPMRYLWDQYDDYFGPGKASRIVRAAVAAIAPGLRRWDVASADPVDRFIANSACVRDRINRHYGRTATVVHPPVDVERFGPAASREDFYLVLGALVPYKRVDLAVEAFNRLGRRLVIAGEGSELERYP